MMLSKAAQLKGADAVYFAAIGSKAKKLKKELFSDNSKRKRL